MKKTPRDTATGAKLVSRRGLVLGGLMFGVSGVLGWRMNQLQVEEADQYRLLAEENRINFDILPPARGKIFDRNGKLIAGNEQNYRVAIIREQVDDVEETIRRLSMLVRLDENDLERARRAMRRTAPFTRVVLSDRLTWEEVSRIAVNAPALPGIEPEVGLSRIYPLGPDFSHIVGYVGPVSDFDLSKIEDPDPLLLIPRFQIGKTGVENKMEADLRGASGAKQIEVNAAGRIMRELGRRPATPGQDVQITVDHAIQNFAQIRMREESAAAVVMDPRNGDLLAVASAPAFDPNLFVRGISSADYALLTENKYRPLATKSVQGAYPPGSTFKMLVALAALDAGVITVNDRVTCRGYTELGNRRFHCWKRGGHGRMNLQQSLSQSCDVYYYDIVQKVGIDRVAEMARRFGMGEAFNLPLSAVREGIMPDKAWKQARHGQSWRIGDSLNASIGQGYVLSTPLQLAVMAARLGSGRMVQPRLVKSVNGVEVPLAPAPPIPVAPEHLAAVQDGMWQVVNGGGTAARSRIVGEEKMAGKTGTSQVRNITAAERAAGVTSNADLPWERRDHALFVGYAPYENPRVAVSVIVEHGGGGSSAAAPVARDILLFALHGGVPPLDAYPSDQRGRIGSMYEELPLAGSPAEAAMLESDQA